MLAFSCGSFYSDSVQTTFYNEVAMETVYSRKNKRYVNVPNGKSYCSHCDRVRAFRYFSQCKTYKNNCFPYCKDCHSEIQKRYTDRVRERYFLRQYGITQFEYDRMLRDQNHVCAICKEPETVRDTRSGELRLLAVDHCHDTGVVRGLLCQRCNLGIGYLRHDVSRLREAIVYLKA